MEKSKKKITEARIINSQDEYWLTFCVLYIVECGSVYNCYNEAAYVVASLTGYRLRKKTRKKDTVYIVTFPKENIDKVIDIIRDAGCSFFRKIGRVIVFRWVDDVPEANEIWNVVAKDIRFELRLDASTAIQLNNIVSNGGFGGRDKANKSEVLRYAIKHFYDNKPVDLKEADSLIKAISTNRDSLQKGLYTLSGMVKELNAIGNNINQIAHNINFLMLKAAEDNIDVADQIKKINGFYNEVTDTLTELMELTDRLKPSVEPAKVAVLSAMEKENEIMNRLLL